MEKVIQKNNPYPDAGGQYNYEDGEFPGKEYSSTGTEELYSIVTESSINKNILSSYPYLWPYKGMKIVIDRIFTRKDRYLYDDDPGNDEGTLNVLLDAYFYDESSVLYPPPIHETDIPGWNSFQGTDTRHRVFRKRTRWMDENADDTIGTNKYKDLNITIEDFPFSPQTSLYNSSLQGNFSGPAFTSGTNSNPEDQSQLDTRVIDKSGINWSKYVSGDRSSNFVIITRMGSSYDNFEWLGLEDPYEVRDNGFQFFYIPKTLFYDLIVNLENDTTSSRELVIQFGYTDYSQGDVDVQIEDDLAGGCFYNYSANENAYWYPSGYDSNSNHPYLVHDNAHTNSNHRKPAYLVVGMIVKLIAPSLSESTYMHLPGGAYNFENFPQNTENFYGDEIVPNYASRNQIHLLKPSSILYDVDLINYGFENKEYFTDFRPISKVETSYTYTTTGDDGVLETDDDETITELYDLQNFYSSSFHRFITSTPITVSLTLDIAQNIFNFFPEYITYDERPNGDCLSSSCNDDLSWDMTWPADYTETGYMGVVTNWNWSEKDSSTLDELAIREWPSSISDREQKNIQDGTYNFIDLADNASFTHTYQNPGVKIIQAVVFSYIQNPQNAKIPDELPREKQIGSLRWKEIKIKINLTLDPIYVQDFTEVGGADYNFIPWTYTTPIIGGVSEESTYYKDVTKIILENNFDVTEYFEKELALNASNNDELGKSLGKIDLAQVRVFNSGAHNMSDLLMIEDQIVDDIGIYHPYDDVDYWNGENNSFPDESCIGEIFIDDTEHTNLKSECIIELNPSEASGNTISDTSGNGNVGIMIGDYSVVKINKSINISRESTSNFPEIETDNKNGAF
jgi:hypothetical protein